MALPRRTTGSLDPTFVPARPVCLAVNLAYALALHGGFPIRLSRALSASVTIWEATAPVKLPVWPCPPPRLGVQVRATELSGWYFTVASLPAETRRSQAPTYPTQAVPLIMTRVQLRCTGSFRLDAGIRRLHRNHKFAEPLAKTVALSLRHSCRSELTRQGISLGFSYSVSREAGLYLSLPVFIAEAMALISSIPSGFRCFPCFIRCRILRNLAKSTRFFDFSACCSKKGT